jgi:mono/diheme cytochrome c family protein
MLNYLKVHLFLILSAGLLFACGESDAPQEKATAAVAEEVSAEIMYLPSQVVYQEEIYKNWPYTKAPSTSAPVTEEVAPESEPETVADDKPYQIVDGVISANAFEGWKTYNGGGCGACHGKGGIGAVGPNLGNSVVTKLSKDDFIKIVTNGKSGTLMRPNKTNKRVMDNMDNLYAYLVARGDDVLGPENLIKFPFGKSK